jgi:hypothetical protein
MADKIKPGEMGSPDDETTTPPEFKGSMAAAIENALNTILIGEGKDALSDDNTPDTRDRRMLFVAIAQGVVRHLSNHLGAFDILRSDDTNTDHHLTVRVE